MENKQIAMAETFLIKVRGSLDHANLMEWEYEGRLNGLSSAPAVRRNLRGAVRRTSEDRFLDVVELHDQTKRVKAFSEKLYDLAVNTLREMEDEHQRQTLWDHYIMEKPIGQIAEENGVSPRTVKRWKKAALQNFPLPEELIKPLSEMVAREEADQAEYRAEKETRKREEAEALEAFRNGNL